jgi:hypothetical protein
MQNKNRWVALVFSCFFVFGCPDLNYDGVTVNPTGVNSSAKALCPPGMEETTELTGEIDCSGGANADIKNKSGEIVGKCINKGDAKLACKVPKDVCAPGGVKQITDKGIICNNDTSQPASVQTQPSSSLNTQQTQPSVSSAPKPTNTTPSKKTSPKAPKKTPSPKPNSGQLPAKTDSGPTPFKVNAGDNSTTVVSPTVNTDGGPAVIGNGNSVGNTVINSPAPKVTSCTADKCGIFNKTACSVACTEPQKAVCSCNCAKRILGACTEIKDECRCE